MPKHGSEQGKRTIRPVPDEPADLVSLYDTKPTPGTWFSDDPARIKYPDMNEVLLLMKKTYFTFSPNAFGIGVETPGVSVSLQEQIAAAKKLGDMFAVWVRSYDKAYPPKSGLPDRGYEMFKAEWMWCRLIINLQLRLLVEQVLFREGYPWRRLVTGFKPVQE